MLFGIMLETKEESMNGPSRYWFPAKRYGWGWGPPKRWEGWLVLGAFVALMVLGSLLFPPNRELGSYLVYAFVLVLLLAGICWLTGEPPRWRWGNDTNDPPSRQQM
jgi:hypothetical protein